MSFQPTSTDQRLEQHAAQLAALNLQAEEQRGVAVALSKLSEDQQRTIQAWRADVDTWRADTTSRLQTNASSLQAASDDLHRTLLNHRREDNRQREADYQRREEQEEADLNERIAARNTEPSRLQTTFDNSQRSLLKGRQDDNRRREAENRRREEQELADLNASIEHRQHIVSSLVQAREAAKAAASSAAKAAEASNAMPCGAPNGVALEHRAPVKGPTLSASAPGQGTPALSTRVMSAAKKVPWQVLQPPSRQVACSIATKMNSTARYGLLGFINPDGKNYYKQIVCLHSFNIIDLLQKIKDPLVMRFYGGTGPLSARLKGVVPDIILRLCPDDKTDKHSLAMCIKNHLSRGEPDLKAVGKLRNLRCKGVKKGSCKVPGLRLAALARGSTTPYAWLGCAHLTFSLGAWGCSLWSTSTRQTRFPPSGANGEAVSLAALYQALAKAAGPYKWREMNEQSLAMYGGVPGVVRLDTEFGATMLIPAHHLEDEITCVVLGQACTLRPSLIATTNPVTHPTVHPRTRGSPTWPSASTPVPKAPPGRAKPERRSARPPARACRGQ